MSKPNPRLPTALAALAALSVLLAAPPIVSADQTGEPAKTLRATSFPSASEPPSASMSPPPKPMKCGYPHRTR